jgi:ribosomal protein S4E
LLNTTIGGSKWTFHKAKIDFGGEILEVSVYKWKDYEGDAVQITDSDGNVYLTSCNNVILIGK